MGKNFACIFFTCPRFVDDFLSGFFSLWLSLCSPIQLMHALLRSFDSFGQALHLSRSLALFTVLG